MRVLVLSFYFPPDLSAGSFRAASLVAALRECAAPGTHIDLITTLPNRYASYLSPAPERESQPGLEVTRIRLPPHRSDMRGQARAFMAFARGALAHTAGCQYDLVFATSSRLMTASLGALIARRQRTRLYLDIRDIFVDTIQDVVPKAFAWSARLALAPLESWTMRRADRINLVSPGFEPYFRLRYGDRKFSWFTNGIDDEFLDAAAGEGAQAARGALATILYAGNIGKGQALHEIVPPLAAALRERARFVIIGDGGCRALLERAVAGCSNVELHAPLPRAALLEAYRGADVLFLHLGTEPAFLKVLPSKIFEYGALGKPLLAGVGGYAASFIASELDNAAVFAPGDTEAAVRAFESLELATRPRPRFVARHLRGRIARAMAQDVLAVATTRAAAS
jgi:glycosyltransferase involved in cell wall biosynthesis